MKQIVYKKLSEITLVDTVSKYFPDTVAQHRVTTADNRTLVVDGYSKKIKTFFEFDGPTHFCNTKTQIRDLCLEEHCRANKINLVRFPYFVQLNDVTMCALSNGKIEFPEGTSKFPQGFNDVGIVYPADFTNHGIVLLEVILHKISKYSKSTAAEIIKTLHGNKDLRLTIGIDPFAKERELLFHTPYGAVYSEKQLDKLRKEYKQLDKLRKEYKQIKELA